MESSGQGILTGVIGNNVKLCLFSDEKELLKYQVFDKSYQGKIEEAICEFLRPEQIAAIKDACFAFAGNIIEQHNDQKVMLTNEEAEHVYSRNKIKSILQCEVTFINDFEAIGHYIKTFTDAQDRMFKVIQTSQDKGKCNNTNYSVYIGGQTGLGVGYLDMDSKKIFTTEGGQTHFSPQSPLDAEFCNYCIRATGKPYISNDLISSELGIKLLHDFLVNSEKLISDVINSNEHIKKIFALVLQKEQSRHKFEPIQQSKGISFQNALTKNAQQGNLNAILILALYFTWLGRIAFDMTVIFKPHTLYLTSAIIGRSIKLFSNTQIKDIFLQSFNEKGRMSYIPLNTNIVIVYDQLMQFQGCYEAIL